jgi:hypothetical protein
MIQTAVISNAEYLDPDREMRYNKYWLPCSPSFIHDYRTVGLHSAFSDG